MAQLRFVVILIISLLLATSLSAEDGAYLVKDFPGKNAGHSIRFDSLWATIGNISYFSADTEGSEVSEPVPGRNVWKTDGTPEGTVPVTSIQPYRQGHAQKFVGVVNGKLLYNGSIFDDGGLYMIDTAMQDPPPVRITQAIAFGRGLVHWDILYYDAAAGLMRTDGTAAGSKKVSLTPSPTVLELVSWGDSLYYIGKSAAGSGLHRWDGVSSSATLVVPIAEGAVLKSLQLLAGKLYFGTKSFESNPAGLWASDGTVEGTRFLHEASGDYESAAMAVIGDKVLLRLKFGATPGQLWSTDGTAAGSAFIGDVPWEPEDYVTGTAAGSQYFFFLRAKSNRFDLYVVDAQGPARKVVEVGNPALPDSFVWNGRYYFSNSDPVHLSEWWESDGTTDGTRRAEELSCYPEGSIAEIAPLVRPDGLLFGAASVNVGVEPWFYDAATRHSRMLKNIAYDGLHGSNPTDFAAAGDKVFFSAHLPDGTRLGTSDGTTAGSIANVKASPRPGVFSGGLYFFTSGDSNSRDLLVTEDGSPEHTRALAAGVVSIVPFRNGVVFLNQWGQLGFSDGTAAGTRLVENLDSYATPFAAGDRIWYVFHGALWVTDLIAPARELTPPGSIGGFAGVAEIGSTVYFLSGTYEVASLWRSDGTEAGTWLVETLISKSFFGARGPYLVVSGQQLFIAVGDLLFRSDGTTAGTVLLPMPQPESLDLGCNPNIVPFRGGVVAHLCEPDGETLWFSGGIGIEAAVLTKIAGYGNGDTLATAHDGMLYFRGWDQAHGYEPWISDGTPSGTRLLADLNPSTLSSDPFEFTSAGKRVFFSAYTGAHGRELWAIGKPFNGRVRAVLHP